jgi:ankyrin repeat protein
VSKAEFTQEELDNSLYRCVEDFNAVAVKILLKAGARPGGAIDQRSGATPLHAAAAKGSIAMCELLIKHGAQIEVKNAVGYTPLGFAVVNGQREAAYWLISKGASSHDKDNGFFGDFKVKSTPLEGMTMREAALRGDDFDRLKDLIENGKPQGPTDDVPSLVKLAKSLKKKDLSAMLQSMAAAHAIDRAMGDEALLKASPR